MRALTLILLPSLAACSVETGNNSAQAVEANNTEMSRPAGAPASNVNDVMGATPGPCGSTRATAFLGRVYRPQMNAEIMHASGAIAMRVYQPTDGDAPGTPTVARRINVLLNDGGQIIMLDCG